MNRKPLIVHVMYSLGTGGVERFVVTLVNHTRGRYRHALICLAGFGELRNEIEGDDVVCVSLDKIPGKDWRCYWKLWRTLRALKPDLVHSYNIGTLDLAPIAKLAGVRRVVHAERGRDAADPNGESPRYLYLRRWMSPFVTRYLPVSRDLESWLVNDVGIDPRKVVCIPNGIDTAKFAVPSRPVAARPITGEFAPSGTVLTVSVGRLDAVKDQAGLVDAFDRLCRSGKPTVARLRLAIVGEGSERVNLEAQIATLGLAHQARLFGNRTDVPALLREADVFVLSSIAEGMPGAVLEAMASGLPVVATRVGGTGELVVDGETGMLVAASDPDALAAALNSYVFDEELRLQHG
ncbi:MAG: glycosyltransferase, partial [Rhodanobacteraceae bacterium]